MVETTNYKLVYDLFDHLLIIDENFRVVFEGAVLKRLLNGVNIDFRSFENSKGNITGTGSMLIEAINSVKSDLEPHSLKIPELPTEFILFPINFDIDPHIVITEKDKIQRIISIERDLKERVKELRCLYNISKELEITRPLDETFEKCADKIREGFQFPELTYVIIEAGKKKYGHSNNVPEQAVPSLYSEIIVDGKRFGEIKVFVGDRKRFLEEEQKLIDEIAGKFAWAIEESEKTANLEKQKKILLTKNEILLRLTEECGNQREKLRAFFSAIADKIVVIDSQYNIIMSNKEEIGDNGRCFEKLFNRAAPCRNCPSERSFESSQHYSTEIEVDEKYYALRSYPIFDANRSVDRVLEVCSDVTMQRKMESQLLQSYKLASLGKLVAGVAHEINNPNTFILGNMKIIQEAFDDILPILEGVYENNKALKIARLDYPLFKDTISTLIKDMVEGANRTKKIVGDLRNFAKKDEGALEDDVDLNDIIKNNLTLTRKHIKKYAQLNTELCEEIPRFRGSINKLEQVILNLVINAAEAIEKEDGVVTIKTGFDKKNYEALLIIKDNGCGMEESIVSKIFDPFFTTKRKKGGTGLGLSISYGIIKDHNGKIDVDSKPGFGTTFTIRFPIKAN